MSASVPRTDPRRFRSNSALLMASIAVSLIILELVARALLPEPLQWRYPQVRYRADTNLGFSLLPDQQAYSSDKLVTINERGLRGPLVPYERTPGAIRLLFLGDSITFGYGVDEQDVLTSRLGERLKKVGIPSDIINSGVPAYNTRQQIDYLEIEGVRYDPDWVIVGLFWNDIAENSNAQVSDDGWLISEGAIDNPSGFSRWLWTSESGHWIRNLIKRVRVIYGALLGWQALTMDPSDDPVYQLRLEVLEGRNSGAVSAGFQQIQNSLHRLTVLSEKHNFRPVVVIFPMQLALEQAFPDSHYPKRILEICEQEKTPLINLEPSFRAAYSGRESLFIPYDGEHPNAKGHALASDMIVKFLIEDLDKDKEILRIGERSLHRFHGYQ